jgi:hypothetical protein
MPKKDPRWKYHLKMKMAKMAHGVALLCAVLTLNPAMAQSITNRPARPTPPMRNPNLRGYVAAKELADGIVPPADADGNFIIGPTHKRAPEMTVNTNVPQGTIYEFTMSSADGKIYPGIARDSGIFGIADTNDPAKLIVTTSHPAPYTRKVAVYVPKQYVPGTAAPFIVGADGPDRLLFTALDNLIAEKKVPVMIAIPSETAAATRKAASAAWNTTPCPADMRSSSRPKCCRLWKANATSRSPKIPMPARRWAAVPAAHARLSWHGIILNFTTAS